MYRLATKHIAKIQSKKRVRISLYPLLTVQPPDLILSSLISPAIHLCTTR